VVFFGLVTGLEAQRYVPGQRLAESDLSVQFGVGRNSVREALQRLAAEGIVDLSRHKGAAIRSLTLKDTLDVLDVAERMTGLLARSAALGAEHSAITGDLERSLEDAARADAANDVAAFSAARRHFYRTLLDMSGNRELKRIFPTIHMTIVHAQYRLPMLQAMRLHDYRRIAQAVIGMRPSAADAAGAAHVRHVRDAVLRQAP
jgi:DNA-binding GntR family transcriptional regulator